MWEYFKEEEFACRHCEKNLISHSFVSVLDNLRSDFGKPLIVTSGYRCPEHNNNVSSTGLDGPHTTGLAVDFGVSREDAYDLLGLAYEYKFTGIGVNQKGSARFIHLDVIEGLGRPTIWSY